MRVRVLAQFPLYWNYAIQQYKPGEEHTGELARHMADNAPDDAVEILEDDREQLLAAADATPAPGSSASPDGGDGDGDGGPAPGDDMPPIDGTIGDLMAWVGDDPDRAARALEAEQAKDKPRSTFVKQLTAITGADDE